MVDVRAVGEDVGATPPMVLGGRYSLTRRIAVGGMGEVWAARDVVLGRQVAVKILRDELIDSNEFLERFRHEARQTAALTHTGITSVFDYGEESVGGMRKAFLVMELVDGEPLSEVIAKAGSLDTAMTLSILRQSAEALHAAHRNGVVHRDVKPGNLMLDSDGAVKLTDFGISRALNAVALTQVGQVIGTVQYMSPEQSQGREATPSSDVYSLGVIGHEMLTGKAPFAGANPAAIALAHVNQVPPPLPSTVPAGLRSLIERSLSKNPADRPHDALEFAREVRALQESTSSTPAATALMVSVPAAETAVMERPVAETAVMTAAVGHHRNRVTVLFALVVAALIGAGALASTSSSTDPLPTDGSVVVTSPPTSTAPEVAAPVAPQTSAPEPVAVPTGGGNGKGQGNGKGKPKDGT